MNGQQPGGAPPEAPQAAMGAPEAVGEPKDPPKSVRGVLEHVRERHTGGITVGALAVLAGVLIGWGAHHEAHIRAIPEVTLDAIHAVPPPKVSDRAIIEALLPFYRITGLSDSTTVALLAWLENVEGYRSHVYTDITGARTIGIGSNLDGGPGLPKAVAVHWALAVLQASCNSFSGTWPPFLKVPEGLRAGFCDASYQLGPNGLEGFHGTLAAVEEGKCVDAVKDIEDSRWASETRNRSDRLANLVQRYGCQPVEGS